jgi:glutaredoxin-related protein
MTRLVLPESRLHADIANAVALHHRAFIEEVDAATRSHAVVVVGMRANPYPRKSCELLRSAGIAYHYIEHGSYFSGWRQRNALKMWSGWPTFPMVFVTGVLVGGYSNLKALKDSGELARMLLAV